MPEEDVSTCSLSLVYIGIGSNLSDPLAQVTRAVVALGQLPGCDGVTVSPWYGSKPVGGQPGQPDYINGVACLRTTLAPEALLDALQALELAQGRERLIHWGARTLDLDLLLYDNLTLSSPRLTIPHPRLQERAFVVCPLADITPALVLPNGASVASLLAGLDTTGIWQLPISPATMERNPAAQQDTDNR